MLAILSLLQGLAACQCGGLAPTATRTPFAPQTAPTPASIQACVEQAYLRQTKRLEFVDPQTKQKRVIDDPEVVRQVVDLLLSPDSRADPAAQGPREPFGIAMIVPVKSADHSVAGYYCPQTHILALGNIATGAWPVSVEGRYTVPSTFGPALFEILGIGSQIAQAESSTAETARGWRSGLVPFWSLERGQLPDDPADTRKHPAQARLGALERGSPEATDPSMAKGWVRSHVALAEGKVYCEVVSPMARHRL